MITKLIITMMSWMRSETILTTTWGIFEIPVYQPYRQKMIYFSRRLFASQFNKNFSNLFINRRSYILKSRPLKLRNASTVKNAEKAADKASAMTKAYGPVAFIVYSSLAFPTFLGCLYSITYLGVTQKDIYNWLDKVKGFFGMEPTLPAEKKAQTNWDFLPEFMKTEKFIEFGTNVLLAMVMTKIFSPLKLTLTAMLTPSAARLFQRFGWFVPKK